MQPPVAPSPVQPLPYASPAGYGGEAMWRQGNQLVVTTLPAIDVVLPNRCVKCNGDTDGRPWRKMLYWHPPGYYLLILFPGLLIYAIVALVIRKKVTVTAGLCGAHRAERRNRILIGWGLFFAALAAFAAAIYVSNDPGLRRGPAGPICGLGGVVLLLAAGVWIVVAGGVLSVRNVTGTTVRFAGAGPGFLGSLPGN